MQELPYEQTNLKQEAESLLKTVEEKFGEDIIPYLGGVTRDQVYNSIAIALSNAGQFSEEIGKLLPEHIKELKSQLKDARDTKLVEIIQGELNIIKAIEQLSDVTIRSKELVKFHIHEQLIAYYGDSLRAPPSSRRSICMIIVTIPWELRSKTTGDNSLEIIRTAIDGYQEELFAKVLDSVPELLTAQSIKAFQQKLHQLDNILLLIFQLDLLRILQPLANIRPSERLGSSIIKKHINAFLNATLETQDPEIWKAGLMKDLQSAVNNPELVRQHEGDCDSIISSDSSVSDQGPRFFGTKRSNLVHKLSNLFRLRG